jgi:hypothetical protein
VNNNTRSTESNRARDVNSTGRAAGLPYEPPRKSMVPDALVPKKSFKEVGPAMVVVLCDSAPS